MLPKPGDDWFAKSLRCYHSSVSDQSVGPSAGCRLRAGRPSCPVLYPPSSPEQLEMLSHQGRPENAAIGGPLSRPGRKERTVRRSRVNWTPHLEL